MTVEYADPEPNGLATLLGNLIEANLSRHPDRERLLGGLLFDITALDAGVSVSVALEGGRVRIANGRSEGAADVHVRTDSRSLLLLCSAPLRLGLPDPLSKAGRQVYRGLARREIRIAGLFRLAKLARVSRLLSVVP